HELIGHCNALASPLFAALYERAGRASRRGESDAALEVFSRGFWFTIEVGVGWGGSELRTDGAGLLSSDGGLDVFRQAKIRDFDIVAMGTMAYDITHYQPVLFAVPSMEWLVTELGSFFDDYDERAYRRWTA